MLVDASRQNEELSFCATSTWTVSACMNHRARRLEEGVFPHTETVLEGPWNSLACLLSGRMRKEIFYGGWVVSTFCAFS